VGVRAIAFGIAAVVSGFVLKSPGTQTSPADAELRVVRAGFSVFGTIHPDVFRLRAPVGAQPPADRIRVASLDPQAGFEAAAGDEQDGAADTSAAAWSNASFAERFASLDDRPASFDERFRTAGRAVTGSVRLLPERDVQKTALPMGRLSATTPMPVAAPKHVRPGQARKDPVAPRDDDGRTAIYDITARVVYLPSGRRLEAHSGLGDLMDNPRYVHVRMRGATPPNVYRLSLRERPFHGDRAIRLTPVDGAKMHGRAGILAHSYLLGPNGQSNGCVSLRDYPEFLNSYLNGEINRLVVVERLDSAPGNKFASGWLPDSIRNLFTGSEPGGQYAAAASY
jgi:hypothetical protein